jgi:general stress protein 26
VSQKSLADVKKVMRDIDIAIFSTVTADGVITTRPVSNNRDVDFDGDSYYFTSEETETVRDIEANPHTVSSAHATGLLQLGPRLQNDHTRHQVAHVGAGR